MKLTKDQQRKLAELRERYTHARADLDTAQADANEAIGKIIAGLNEGAIADLNTIVEEANALREEVESDAQGYYDEKSEKWQEGERGEAFSEWLSAWGNELGTIDEIDAAEVEMPEVPEDLLPEDDYPDAPAQ